VRAPEPQLRGLRAEGVHPPCDLLGAGTGTATASVHPSVWAEAGSFSEQAPDQWRALRPYSLGLRRGSASFRMVRVERDRPFPDMPPGTLDDGGKPGRYSSQAGFSSAKSQGYVDVYHSPVRGFYL
jgi:hypothetical protein